MKQLALTNGQTPRTRDGPPTQKEIDEIKRKHKAVVEAARTTLPTAMEIGEWFIRAHEAIGHGGWEKWLNNKFPEIGLSTIRGYAELGQNRQFLEAKFEIATDSDLANPNFSKWPSIGQAKRAIRDKDQPRRGSKGRSNQNRVIDVKATVNGEVSNIEPAETAVQISPPAGIAAQGPVEDPDQEPKNILRVHVAAYVKSQLLVFEALKTVVEWIELAQIDEETVKWAIDLACLDHPELEHLVILAVQGEQLRLTK